MRMISQLSVIVLILLAPIMAYAVKDFGFDFTTKDLIILFGGMVMLFLIPFFSLISIFTGLRIGKVFYWIVNVSCLAIGVTLSYATFQDSSWEGFAVVLTIYVLLPVISLALQLVRSRFEADLVQESNGLNPSS